MEAIERGQELSDELEEYENIEEMDTEELNDMIYQIEEAIGTLYASVTNTDTTLDQEIMDMAEALEGKKEFLQEILENSSD